MKDILFKIYKKYAQIVKYLTAGSIATFVDLLLIYIFTDLFHVWYLISTILAFALAFFVSFYLQKFWTFCDSRKNIIYGQMIFYLVVNLLNLVINTGLMYLLVDIFNIWYMLAQIIILGFLAVWNFVFCKYIIFKKCEE